MKILITGGGGFIGSHITDLLIKDSHTVSIIDNGESMCPEWKNSNAIYYSFDILKPPELDWVFKITEPEIIIHLAAHLEITESQKKPINDLVMNTGGTINVLEAMKKHDVKKLINASSACVYGQMSKLLPASTLIDPAPHWPYGVSKLAAEKYIGMYCSNYNMSAVSFRYGIVFGPREWYGRVLTNFFRKAKEGKPLIVFGDGRQIRDFVPVKFAAEQTCLALNILQDDKANLSSHYKYNVATGLCTTIKDLAEMISTITTAPIIYEEVLPGKTDSTGRVRIPDEMDQMVMVPTPVDLSSAPLYTQSNLYSDLEKMWDWIQKTDLKSLKTWRFGRV